MKAIVTVKLKRKIKHDPRNKKRGSCPLMPNTFCTDITGSHHSFLIEGIDSIDLEAKAIEVAKEKCYHITRIEVVLE